MCQFVGQTGTVRDLTPDDPAYGYKALLWDRYWKTFVSTTYRRACWGSEALLSARNDMDRRCVPRNTGSGPGIYAWRNRRDAVPLAFSYGVGVTVEVALWGRVIEYDGYKGIRPGFMAEHAEIHTVYIDRRALTARPLAAEIREKFGDKDVQVRYTGKARAA